MSDQFRSVTHTGGGNYQQGTPSQASPSVGDEPLARTRDASKENLSAAVSPDGTVKVTSHEREVWQAINNHAARGIMATARTQSGTPISADRVGLESIVMLPNGGGTTRVREAVALGFIKQTADGRFVDATAEESAAAAAARNAQPTPVDDTEALPDRVANDTYNELVQQLPQEMLMGFVHKLTTAEGADQATYDNMAAALGVKSDDFRAGVSHVFDAMREQAVKAIADVGADPQAFETWALENAPREYRKAALEHAMKRNTSGWRALAEQYLQKADIDPEALAAHRPDIDVIRKLGNGDTLVNIPGYGEMALRVARRMGLV